ncbi:MAG TPA: glycosyltransferase family 4 protein [Candidatus Limnocylindrales bacterium]|nr:glycosyltransferase family 4 protein [Candidatus Limnocylindrales bacterium]
MTGVPALPEGDRDGRQRLRIALIAPPVVPLPPTTYAGTERIVASLAEGLHARGHRVTVFASGDSELSCEIVPVVPRSLWAEGQKGDMHTYLQMAVARAWDEVQRFDIIHSHVEWHGFLFARHSPVPVVTTMHRRLDIDGLADYIDRMPMVPLVAISDSQRRWNPDANWVATIHHGLDFGVTPSSTRAGDYLLLVGRVSREKGLAEAIEVAKATRRRLVIAAKMRESHELELFDSIVQPAIDEGVVDWRGEIDTVERDRLMAGAFATLMLGGWPEPFGLVAIESMATGTPVIGRRAGGLTEIVDHGRTGFLVDDIEEAVFAVKRIDGLDREGIARDTRERFGAKRMIDEYEAVYTRLVDGSAGKARSSAPIANIGERRAKDGLVPVIDVGH